MDFRLPELGEGIYEAELINWLVKPGVSVRPGQSLMEVMTDKATMEVPSPFVGTIKTLQAQPGEIMKVGQPVLEYEGKQAAGEPPPPEETRPPQAHAPAPAVALAAPTGSNGPSAATALAPLAVRAAPSVRLLARKLGMDLARVHGTGPEGRILIEDLTPHLAAGRPKPAFEPRYHYGTPGTRLKLHGLRRKIAEHMVQAKRVIPHATYVDECEVTELIKLRDSLKDEFAQGGIKLTYLSFFIKAVVQALKEVPVVNASFDEAANDIVLHDRYHIGIAVATAHGLLVPVLHHADRMDLVQIAREVDRLTTAARTNKLKIEDLRDGTFTITSFGGLGGLLASPIINHPEVAILGIGKIIRRPVYDAAGNLRPADLVYLSHALDHRVFDGAVAAAFCNAVIRRIQHPASLLLPERL
jgi:pyruvate dehydrogenase E2 component (dihydrolipoamide acetyltransferase)/2-oxoisovalerate dehydrogenase E2 component (dihydrolipoyl transacylase)